jgi:hypothetical protein
MRLDVFGIAVLLASVLGAAPIARAQTAAPGWKLIYEDNQTAYYVAAGSVPSTGEATTTSLIQYKIAQVVGGAQVWSIVSHMKLSCDQREIMTVDNTLYASKMGTGPVVQSQPSSDNWHEPQPDSLGGLIWAAACGKP